MHDDWTVLSSALAAYLGPEATTRALVALAWPGEAPTHRRRILAGILLASQGWTVRRPGWKGARERIYVRPAPASRAA